MIAVGVVSGIVVDHYSETNARSGVRVPFIVAGVGVTIITDEAGILVTALDVVGGDVVLVVSPRRDPGRQIGERNVGVAPNSAIGDDSKVPVVTPGDLVVLERKRRGDGKEVSNPRVVIDGE
jgi:hypothetical protein